MKVAITGGNGFIGNVLIKELRKKKIALSLLDRKKHNLLKPASLKSLVEGKDTVIHLAAVNRTQDNLDFIKINTLGTLSLLEAMSKYSPNSRIIFASTFQVYLENNLYGLSKKFAEDLIKHYAQTTNIAGSILRLSNVYGPEGKPFYNSVVATFAHLIKTGETLKINGDGSQKRDFIYVNDVAEAITKAILTKRQSPLEVVDICSGKETSLKQVLQTIKRVSGKSFEVVYNKTVKEKPWPTKGKNFKKAKRLFGWEPKTPISKGLKKVISQ